MIYLPLLAFIAGVLITAQTSLNTQLGQLLKSPILATGIAFTSSLAFILCIVGLFIKQYPSPAMVKSVPLYLWFSGGLLSAVGVALFYWLIPKMGAGAMISCAMSGQIIVALVAGHYGWFNLQEKPLTFNTIVGCISLIIGVWLINRH
ncbi:MAG: DMT family transporter [Colwellia sp.]|nr:DMT family transporter [Colwellia sp.]